jgi:hypothetical protein
VEKLGAVAEEDGLDGRVFAFAFCHFGGLEVVLGGGVLVWLVIGACKRSGSVGLLFR